MQMTPILGVVGTSWAAGYRSDIDDLDHDTAWPKLVSRQLNFELIDESEPASSIARIYRKTMDLILSDKCAIIIVELASIKWYELGSSITGKIIQLNGSVDLPFNKTIMKEYNNKYFSYTNALRAIISLQALAKNFQTPLYFIDVSAKIITPLTLDSFIEHIIVRDSSLFDALNDDMILERFNIAKQLDDAIDHSKFLFLNPLVNTSITPDNITKCFDESLHPTVLGQQIIANLILESLGKLYEIGITDELC